MPVLIPQLIIAAGLFLLAELLRKKPPGQKPQSEPRLSTSTYGQVIPFVIGTARLSPNIVWYGDFRADPIRKRVSLFAKQTVAYNYFLSVQEVICLGCIDRLESIFIGEDRINIDAIDLAGSDGVTLAIPFNGKDTSFTIKPGNSFQTKISSLNITPETGYPYICYTYYNGASLGQGSNWPNISYVVTRYPKTYLSSDVPVIVSNSTGSGVNPAHAILEILTNPLLGPILKPLDIDFDSLVNIGRTFKNEGLFVNFAITDSTSAKEILASLFNDFGILCFEEFDKLSFKLLRESNEEIVIDNTTNSLLIASPEYSVNLSADNANNISYDFTDRALNYRLNNLQDFDIGSIVRNSQRKFQSKILYFVDNLLVAQKLVALAKSINSAGFEVNEFEITAYDVIINPGNIVVSEQKKWRVTRVELRNNIIKLGVIRDPIRFVNLTFNDNVNLNTTSPMISESIIGLEEEFSTHLVQATVFELPWEIHNSERPFLYVPALRPNGFIVAADYVIRDNVANNYILAGESNQFCLGLKVVSTDATYIYLDDIGDSPIDDVQVSNPEWNNNTIIGFNKSEFISFRAFSTTQNNDWKVDRADMLRGRLGTEEQTTINVNTIIYFNQGAILNNSLIRVTTELMIKILPATPTDQITENETVPLTTMVNGTALNPLPVENLTYNRSGLDVIFSWELYEKSDSGKQETVSPSYNVQLSMNNSTYSTLNVTTVTWTNASPITIFIRTEENGRTSIKRFTTSN